MQALKWKSQTIEENQEQLRSNGQQNCRTRESEEGGAGTAEFSANAGKGVSVKNGQPVVVTAQVVGEYGSYESAAHGIKVENGDVRSESIMFD